MDDLLDRAFWKYIGVPILCVLFGMLFWLAVQARQAEVTRMTALGYVEVCQTTYVTGMNCTSTTTKNGQRSTSCSPTLHPVTSCHWDYPPGK